MDVLSGGLQGKGADPFGDAARKRARASVSENTRRSYEAALGGFGGSGRPGTGAGVAAYPGDLFREGRLTQRSIRSIIIRRARDAGVKGRISGHSLRVGSAQSLAAAGASLVEMQFARHAGALRAGKTRGRGRRGGASLGAVTNRTASAGCPAPEFRYFFRRAWRHDRPFSITSIADI